MFKAFLSEVISAALGVAVVDSLKAIFKKDASRTDGATSRLKAGDVKRTLGEMAEAVEDGISHGAKTLDSGVTPLLRGANRWLQGRWWVKK